MSAIIQTLDDAISFVNTLYEVDSTVPTAGDEDYLVWTALLNVAVNLWESEEGMLWKELFVKLANAADGTKTTTTATSYSCPTDFKFPASGYIWLGSGTTKVPYKVKKIQDVQLYENNTGNWCYFVLGNTPTLEFNPNLSITAGQTINYNYYKKATKLATGTDKFDMSDPMFAVYYALAELKEGDATASAIATQKIDAMKTKNEMSTWWEEDSFTDQAGDGFGIRR